ncbi:uncharacterized protein LOC135377904 [Ornithodoros turicata]|uniref:uncharacterized protein LOC135377904 n=1 Tax=Ornithodoros turicata TaxID=34597 RepID=UPI0031386C54
MKRFFVFFVKDVDTRDTIQQYLQNVEVANRALSSKLRFAGKHLVSLLPDEKIYVAILPLLMCSSGGIESLLTSWTETSFDCFETDLDVLINELLKFKDLYQFPSNLTSDEGNSAARFLHELLGKLPAVGTYTIDIAADEYLFDELDLESNVQLYGALLRACTWYHVSIQSLNEHESSTSYTWWLDHLGIQRSKLLQQWITVWKGHLHVPNGSSFGNVELQVKVHRENITASHPEFCRDGQPEVLHSSPLHSHTHRIWSSELEILDEFHIDTFRMHLICPILFRLLSHSHQSSNVSRFIQQCGEDNRKGFILRLSYWEDNDVTKRQTSPSMQAWRKAVQQKTLSRIPPRSQDPTGHLHFILIPSFNSAMILPLWKDPAYVDATYLSTNGNYSQVLPSGKLSEAMKSVPCVLTTAGALSLYKDRCLQIRSNTLAGNENVSNVSDATGLLRDIWKEAFILESGGTCRRALPAPLPASEDPSDWPERRFLLQKSLLSSKPTRHLALSKSGAMQPSSTSVSAKDILKLFKGSGEAKHVSKETLQYIECKMKPSITAERLDALAWPYLLHCKYHDLYYNTDTEELESSCNAAKEQLVMDETLTTFDSNLLPTIFKLGPTTKTLECESLQTSPRKNSLAPHAPPVTLRRSPRKRPLIAQNEAGTSSSSLQRRSPRKLSTTQHLRKSPWKRSESARDITSTRKTSHKSMRRKAQVEASSRTNEKLKMKVRIAVANALESHGIAQKDPLFNACGKKLLSICKTFAQDLLGSGRTTQQLQHIADSHAAQVINFERLKIDYNGT